MGSCLVDLVDLVLSARELALPVLLGCPWISRDCWSVVELLVKVFQGIFLLLGQLVVRVPHVVCRLSQVRGGKRLL